MRKILKYIYLLPLFLVVSCTFSEGLSLDEVLKVSNTTFEFDKSATSQTLEIESYISWEASTDAEWIEISPKSGLSGVTTMVLTVYENKSVESRSSVIKIVNSEYGIEQEILVSQSESVPELEVNREKIEDISFDGSTEQITIESNISWEASTDAEWIGISPKSGVSGITTMTLTVNKNTSVESRSSVIRIVNSEYNIEQGILVTQSESVPELEVNREKIEDISFDGSTEQITIESNISWEASTDAEWIGISPKSGVSGITTMTLTVNKNTSVESRSSVIRIVNSEYGIEQEILVTQSELVPELKVNVEKLENISFEGSNEEIRIMSNISWEASVDVDWIGISPKSGLSGVTTMTIDVNKNTSVASRSAVIRIVNSEYEIEEEILVNQSELAPELKVNVEKLENISYNGSIEEIKIESSISWNAWVNVDWIEISPKSGESGVCTMTIVVGENVLEESRDGVITLKNQEYSLTTEVIIQQLSHTINGYEYVDLGLPSGLKWATCNVGANSPEDYGDYYAWGEIDTKGEYTLNNSKTRGKSMSDISGNSMYDVARAKWGGSWRLPTKKELEELESKCTWEWTTQNGKEGYKVIGPNGNSIFMPAAGGRIGSSLGYVGESGFYRSSTPDESNDDSAYILYFNIYNRNVGWDDRSAGMSVRPVSE